MAGSRLSTLDERAGTLYNAGMRKNFAALLILSSLAFALPHAESGSGEPFEITEAVMCADFNKESRKPIAVTSEFPKGTKVVHSWFSWKNAAPGLKFIARWHFVSGNIHILDLPVTLTRHMDHGIVSLEMPKGKTFPAGSYRLDFEYEGRTVKTISFTVF